LQRQLATLALIGLVVTCIALSGSVTLVRAQHQPEMCFESPHYTAHRVGEEFNVTVYIEDVEASQRIVGLQFRVPYDPNLVEATNVYEGSFLSRFNNTAEPPYTFFISSIEVDVVYGPDVLVGILILPDETGVWTNFPSGSGILATITFKALYRPIEPDTVVMPLTLENTLIIDDNIDEVPHRTFSALYEPAPITRPVLTITPAEYTASLIGETFNTTVAINNLDPDALSYGQRLVGVMFRVQYDPTLLKPIALYEGGFLKQFNNTESPPYTFLTYSFEDDPTYGPNVLVGILVLPNGTGVWTNFPVGSGTLSTITFEAIAQPGEPQPIASSALTLATTQLINDTLDDIPHTTQNGLYQILPLSFNVESPYMFAGQPVTLTTLSPPYPITYTWNFGDGTSSTIVHNPQGSGTGTDTINTGHVYASQGTYNITLTCTVGDTVSGIFTSSAATRTATVQPDNRPTIDLVIDSGSIYFRGETAEFSILATNHGESLNVTSMEALLYNGNSLFANLTESLQTVTTGFYRIAYTIPADANFGTYTLLVKSEYYNARGTTTKTFQISQMLTAAITQIENGIATIQTDMNTIKVNLTSINASISGLIVDAKGTLLAQIDSSIGTLTARLDTINATITAINGNIVTISTTLGDVKTRLSDEQTMAVPAIYTATVFSIIAAILVALVLIRTRRK